MFSTSCLLSMQLSVLMARCYYLSAVSRVLEFCYDFAGEANSSATDITACLSESGFGWFGGSYPGDSIKIIY